ncbi:uricase [Coprinellus micaceus]|uniref:Uricase n=1 Tax=Coprinellus micaceus TaxID=71717 RepID=A0A4Y7TBX0_COPMI|nr:uricase [Coprinellus micaceus]
MASELSTLAYAKYGKTNEGLHTVVEYNVETLLEGDIETSYTQADNSVVVATDSVKNITYFLAKTSPHILSPEKFALHIGTFFASNSGGLRITVNGKEHKHSFYRDGDDRRVIKAGPAKHAITASLTSGLTDLLVLKSTGSAFENFYRDEYTTLAEVDDRIFSTSVDLTFTFSDIKIPAPQDDKKLEFQVPLKEGDEGFAGSVWDDSVAARARTATLEVFATDESASVQATLYKMGQRIIAENAGVKEVTYVLPNKHYIPVDMKYIRHR